MNDFRVPAAEAQAGAQGAAVVTTPAEPPAFDRAKAFLWAKARRAKRMFFSNPMRMEIVRFKSRFVNCTTNLAFNRALVWLVALSYLCIFGLTFAGRADVQPVGVVMTQAILLLIGTALAAHGSIAAERDRRSWDLLQVAPISQGEIVVGKFQGIAAIVAAISLLFLPLVIIGLIFYQPFHGWPLVGYTALAELVSVSASLLVAAFTIYLSAKLKNANSALAASMATLVGVLGALVGVLYALALPQTDQDWGRLLFWHPIYVIERMVEIPSQGQSLPPFWALSQSAVYVVLAWFFLAWTTRLLKRAKE